MIVHLFSLCRTIGTKYAGFQCFQLVVCNHAEKFLRAQAHRLPAFRATPNVKVGICQWNRFDGSLATLHQCPFRRIFGRGARCKGFAVVLGVALRVERFFAVIDYTVILYSGLTVLNPKNQLTRHLGSAVVET